MRAQAFSLSIETMNIFFIWHWILALRADWSVRDEKETLVLWTKLLGGVGHAVQGETRIEAKKAKSRSYDGKVDILSPEILRFGGTTISTV